MAAITKNELHPNVGSAWKRAVELWELYVVESTWTLTASCTYTDGIGCIRMVIDDTTDVTTYNLMLLDCLDGTAPAVTWPGQPGFEYMPGMKLATYGPRDTKADFASKLVAVRRSLYGFFSQAAAIGGNVNDDLSLPVNSANARLTHFIVKERMCVWVDYLVCPVAAAVANYTWYGNRVGNEGVVPSALNVTLVSGGGGGEVDIDPLTQAVRDVASKTQVVGINNGEVLYAMESGEVIEAP